MQIQALYCHKPALTTLSQINARRPGQRTFGFMSQGGRAHGEDTAQAIAEADAI
jgi:hypothetical protein